METLYHGSEGSEFVPYCALKVYAQTHGYREVAGFFDHYHLLPDVNESNDLGLPIGLTVNKNLFNMIGFNCAACHVGGITADASFITVGGPGAFNIRQFYDDLLPWLSDLPAKPDLLRKVAGCMLHDAFKPPKSVGAVDAQYPEPEVDAVSKELPASERSDGADAGTELFDHVHEVPGKPEKSAPAEEDMAQASAQAEAHSPVFRALPRDKKRHVIRGLWSKLKVAKALLLARANSLAVTSAVGEITYTKPGPGRIDAFMTALNLMNPGAKLQMTSPVAFPPLWGIGGLSWLHYDNNTNKVATLQRNMGQAVGVGALLGRDPGEPTRVLGTTLDVLSLIKLEGLVERLKAPAWPFTQPDPASVEKGKQTYLEHCARCHEADSDGRMPKPPDGPDSDPKTDPNRLTNFNQTDAVIAAKWPGKKLIEVLAAQVAAAEKASKANGIQPNKEHPIWRQTGAYGARSLHGVWATAPYLHNNSVPTLADLLTAPDQRPKRFITDYDQYDVERVGFKQLSAATPTSPEFDSAAPEGHGDGGNGNGGHAFGTDLSDADKKNLIAYLKQL